MLGLFVSVRAKDNLKTSVVKFPLTPVSVDSITIGDFFWYGQILNTKKVDSTLKVQPFIVTRKDVSRAKKMVLDWQEKVKNLTLFGSVSTEKDELPSAVNMVKESALLSLATGDAKYGGVMERAYYNGVCGRQESDSHEEALLASQWLVNVPNYIMATSQEHLYINMYIRNTAHVKNKHLDVNVLTIASTPWFNQVSLQFKFPTPARHMVLHLRKPSWLSDSDIVREVPNYHSSHYNGRFTLFVNGNQVVPKLDGGYIVIDRVWKDSDYVQMFLPAPVRRFHSNSSNGAVALQKGPLLYTFLSFPQEATVKENDLVHTEFFKDRHTDVISGPYYDAAGKKAGKYSAEPYVFHLNDSTARLFVPCKP